MQERVRRAKGTARAGEALRPHYVEAIRHLAYLTPERGACGDEESGKNKNKNKEQKDTVKRRKKRQGHTQAMSTERMEDRNSDTMSEKNENWSAWDVGETVTHFMYGFTS